MQEASLIPGSGRSSGEGIGCPLQYSWASLVAQLVKNLPALWETWVQSLGWEDPLQKGTASHSSSLDCIVHGVTKSRTWLSGFHFHTHTHIHTHICITEAHGCVRETLLKNYTSIKKKKKRNLRCLLSSSCSSSTQVIIDISSRSPRGKRIYPFWKYAPTKS